MTVGPKPTPRLPAFLGGLWDIGLRASARRIKVQVALPMDELGDVLRLVGLPAPLETAEAAWEDGRLAPLAILPVRAPRHPQTEADAIAEAAADLILRGLEDGTVRLTPALSDKLGALHAKRLVVPFGVPCGEEAP